MDASEPTLATVLQTWMRQERLRAHQVAEGAGLTHAHFSLIKRGRILRPTPETLRKLAASLAADPYEHTVDQAKRERALREMSRAAGYPDLSRESEPGALVREIQAVVGNHQVAVFWETVIREHPHVSPTIQQLIRGLLRLHDQPGGEDAIGLLLGPAMAALPAEDEDLPSLLRALIRLRNGMAHPPG